MVPACCCGVPWTSARYCFATSRPSNAAARAALASAVGAEQQHARRVGVQPLVHAQVRQPELRLDDPQGIGRVRVAGLARMGRDADGLIDDHDVVVLVQDGYLHR